MTGHPDQALPLSVVAEASSEGRKTPRFGSLLLVTYGRSGSTLLQGVLNTLPSVLVRGENHDFCWGLYVAWKSLVVTKTKYGRPNSMSATDAWYGATNLDPQLFKAQARELLKAQLLPDSGASTVVWGFKEIRYLDHLDELHAFLDFLTDLLPRPAIIFNTRDHEWVCRSAFWKRFPEQELRKKLTVADRLFFEYAERSDHAFVCRYERVVLGEQALRPLFDFLGTYPDPNSLLSTLQMPQSFVPKVETLESAVRHRERISGCNDFTLPDGNPCRPERPFTDYQPSGKVTIFCTVKDERIRLPWFLEYYRGLGCRDFVFIDTGSQDETVSYLKDQPDVYLYHAPADQFAFSRSGSDWINALGPKHAMHRWILVADIDEILAWPEQDREGLEGLAIRAERLGLNRAFTPMIDVYPEDPCDTLPYYEPGEPFAERAHLMDDVVHTKALWDAGRLILYSGPRARHAKTGKRPPIMTKQNFYYIEPVGYQHLGPHFDTYARPSPLVVPFLHFKFLPDFKTRMKKAISEGQHWNNAAEYKQYAAEQLSARTLAFEGSVDFRSTEGLKKYIDTVSKHIRTSGMCGSVHWRKFVAETGSDVRSGPQNTEQDQA